MKIKDSITVQVDTRKKTILFTCQDGFKNGKFEFTALAETLEIPRGVKMSDEEKVTLLLQAIFNQYLDRMLNKLS